MSILAGKKAFVVGGSGGIGRALVCRMAAMGADLVVHGGSNRTGLQMLLSELRRQEVYVKGISAVIERSEDILEHLEEALPIDLLAICFGPFLRRSIEDTDLSEWRRMAELNFVLPAAALARCLPAMRNRNYGRVVLFGGTRATSPRGYREIAAYAAAKASLFSLVRSAALQVQGYNITVNALCPDYVETEYLNKDAAGRYSARTHTGRPLTPERVAEVAALLLRPESSHINGALLPIMAIESTARHNTARERT